MSWCVKVSPMIGHQGMGLCQKAIIYYYAEQQCWILLYITFIHFRGHKSYITSVSVFDKYVFTGGADARIKKWDLASCRPMFTYTGHNSKIHKLLVTEELVFSTSHDKSAKVWHTRITKANHTRACIRTLKVFLFLMNGRIKSLL